MAQEAPRKSRMIGTVWTAAVDRVDHQCDRHDWYGFSISVMQACFTLNTYSMIRDMVGQLEPERPGLC